ncbi:hypothetical protein AcW1_001418 [Taiwanofungus camphoratus]|nr:hypothetical protein AcV5_005346 [Antrodia cinnamomea]KAI0962646.1 hypothetical protein AcV7_001444 [Antrodia cinnamomea]KAI0964648.1 hypothetical protein AcW1_001418 [Antrodia cinnamomea]
MTPILFPDKYAVLDTFQKMTTDHRHSICTTQSGRFSLTPSQSFFLEGVQRSAAWIDLRSEISRTKSASRRTYQDRMLGRDAEACRLTRSWSLSALMIWAIC